MSRKMREKYAKADGRNMKTYEAKPLANLSDEELLYYLRKFYESKGRAPTSVDLEGLDGYPHPRTYYRRFKDCTKGYRKRNWNDILLLAGITPLDMEKVWIAWEYLVSVACEKLYSDCLFQPCDLVAGYRPDIVVVSEKLVIDAATSNYDHRHKKRQFQKAVKAGYQVEYWCLYKTTENGINEAELTYVFSDEIIAKLERMGEQEIAEDMKNLLEHYETYAEKILHHRKQYIAEKLREAFAILGHTPTVGELESLGGFPTIAQIKKLSAHYNDAIIYANLPIKRKKIPLYDEQLAIRELVELTNKLGKIPTYYEVNQAKLTYTTKVYTKHFKGVRNCLKQQGFDVEALLAEERAATIKVKSEPIKAFYLQHNRMPSRRDYLLNKELPSHNWVVKCYGSMEKLEEVILGAGV